MRTFVRIAAVAALSFVALTAPATAGTSTPNGDPYIGELVQKLQEVRETTFTDPASPQAKAIDFALKQFADPSSGYNEDINDMKKAFTQLRKVFGTDAGADSSGLVAEMNQQSAMVRIVLLGWTGLVIPPIKSLKQVALIEKKNQLKESARLAAYSGIAKKLQAAAKKHKPSPIDLYGND